MKFLRFYCFDGRFGLRKKRDPEKTKNPEKLVKNGLIKSRECEKCYLIFLENCAIISNVAQAWFLFGKKGKNVIPDA